MSTLPVLLQYVESLGHRIFTSGTYNMNIIGIRSANPVANAFDDRMCVVYKDEDGWVTRTWACTTDPGNYYLMNPDKQFNPLGTAILVAGQYRSTYVIGPHGKTKYEALTQRGGKVKVYRDNNHDDILDLDPDDEYEGWYGINIHASSMTPYDMKDDVDRTQGKVGAWSGGCQVFARDEDFRAFMDLVRKSSEKYGNKFTYTLVQSPTFPEEAADG